MATKQTEERFRRRASQPDKAVYTPLGAVEWAAANPQTIAGRDQRQYSIVTIEVAGGGSVRVAGGDVVASATVGTLLDSANGPLAHVIDNLGAISIYAITGAEDVQVADHYLHDGTVI